MFNYKNIVTWEQAVHANRVLINHVGDPNGVLILSSQPGPDWAIVAVQQTSRWKIAPNPCNCLSNKQISLQKNQKTNKNCKFKTTKNYLVIRLIEVLIKLRNQQNTAIHIDLHTTGRAINWYKLV